MDYIAIYAIASNILSKITSSASINDEIDDDGSYQADLIEYMRDSDWELLLDKNNTADKITLELFKMLEEYADIQYKIENMKKQDYYRYNYISEYQIKDIYENKIKNFEIDEMVSALSQKYPSEVTSMVKYNLERIKIIFEQAIKDELTVTVAEY